MYKDSNGFAMAQKLEAKGGKGGKEWDDGAGHGLSYSLTHDLRLN